VSGQKAKSFNSFENSLDGVVTMFREKLAGGDEREHAGFPQ
jgi:hypothetical protein